MNLVSRLHDRVHELLFRLSLHRRIALFVSSILLAVFLAFGYVGWEGISRSTGATLQERHATALVVARHLDDLVGHARAHLLVVANELASSQGELDREQTGQVLERSLHQLRFFFTHLLVVDLNGRVVAGAPPPPDLAMSGEAKVVLDQAIATRQSIISNLLQLPVEQSYGVVFVAPVVVGDRVLGAVIGEMLLPHPSITSVSRELSLGRSGHMEVIDGKGWVLSSTEPDEVYRFSEHHSFYHSLLKGGISTVDRARYEREGEGDEENVWHVMAFVPLGNAPWGVGLGQDEAETFAATRDLRDRALAVAAVALAVALFSAWVGTQSVVRPILALTRSGERMATGDLSEPVKVIQADEVGRLGQALEIMRQRLGSSIADIASSNRELERRVHERTQALVTSNRHLQALMAVATAAARGTDHRAVLKKALQELVDTLDVESGWAFLWDEDQRQLRLVSGYQVPKTLESHELVVMCSETACAAALRSSDIICQDQGCCAALPSDLRDTVKGTVCWCAPIRMGEQALGVLCFATAADRRLEPDEVALVHGIAQQIGVAFENARLTEETARLEAARRAELLRAELLGSVSHELRTPLGFIKGYSTTLLRDDVRWNPEEQREFLRIIDEECDRLSELVESLLDAARVHPGRLRLRCQPIQVEELLRRSMERLDGSLEKHQIALRLEASPTISADGPRLEQVVMNLLQNAVKYSPNGGLIEIHASGDDNQVRIGVLDRGVGIPAGEASRIFEPFYRGKTGHAASIGGVGLGLAICRAIVEAHGGRIWAEPRSDGGTAVWVILPRTAPAA